MPTIASSVGDQKRSIIKRIIYSEFKDLYFEMHIYSL